MAPCNGARQKLSTHFNGGLRHSHAQTARRGRWPNSLRRDFGPRWLGAENEASQCSASGKGGKTAHVDDPPPPTYMRATHPAPLAHIRLARMHTHMHMPRAHAHAHEPNLEPTHASPLAREIGCMYPKEFRIRCYQPRPMDWTHRLFNRARSSRSQTSTDNQTVRYFLAIRF